MKQDWVARSTHGEDLVNLLVYMTMSVSLQYRLDYCCRLQVSDLTRFNIRTMWGIIFFNLRFDNDVNELLTHFFTYLVYFSKCVLHKHIFDLSKMSHVYDLQTYCCYLEMVTELYSVCITFQFGGKSHYMLLTNTPLIIIFHGMNSLTIAVDVVAHKPYLKKFSQK